MKISSSSWQRKPIGSVCLGIYDGPHATPKVSENGPIFLGIKNITEDGRLDLSEIRHINEHEFPKWTKRVTPKEGDIVFTYEATLNRYAIIPKGFRGCLGRRLALIRTDPQKADYRFLFLYFFSDDWRRTISQNLLSGATVDRIPIGKFPEFEISLPSLESQIRIADILSAYDRLIENNTRRIKILEEMAQNLYREWFVNFRFSGHGQTKLIDSGTDLGQIPEGWKICNLGDLVSFKTGKLNANAAKPNGEYPFFTCSQEIYRTDTYSFDTECILLAGNNANGVFHIKFFNGKFDAYQRTYVIQSLNSKINSNHYFFFAISSQLERLKSLSTGAATKFLTLTILNNVKILISDPYTQSSFRKFASTFFDQIDTLKSKNENLTKTRDLLLPKLISGEIDVESLDMDKEAIAA
jgi:type I restriction enzyme, S subunit